MNTLREFIKESNISIDELLDTFYLDEASVNNDVQEKIKPDRETMASINVKEYYSASRTITIIIKQTRRHEPEFYGEK